jgi:hypothetical protein
VVEETAGHMADPDDVVARLRWLVTGEPES